MGIVFLVVYHEAVVTEDIPTLSTTTKRRVRSAIEGKLTIQPETFGKPLRRSLKGYRKLRVGDYRVIFRIDGVTVRIFAILHRSVVYENIEKRL